jgi:hypothetical protein
MEIDAAGLSVVGLVGLVVLKSMRTETVVEWVKWNLCFFTPNARKCQRNRILTVFIYWGKRSASPTSPTGSGLIVTHEVTNVGSDRSQLASVAKQTKDTLALAPPPVVVGLAVRNADPFDSVFHEM